MAFSPQEDSGRALVEEEALRTALAGDATGLWRLPPAAEQAFRQHCRTRASTLLRKAIYALFGLHMLVLIPVYYFYRDPSLLPWAMFTTGPIATALAGLWLSTRLYDLEAYVDGLISIAVGVCLTGTLYSSMHLDGQYFGELAQFETVYVLLIALIVLPPRLSVPTSLTAAGVALLVAYVSGGLPSWLQMLLYFGVPLSICTVIGLIMEYSERRNFVQHLLLNRESQRLAQLHASAEENIRQQQFTTEFLTLISGNLSLKELFSRTLGFLVEHTGAQVGAGYHLAARGRLRRISAWALDAEALEHRKEVEPGDTLMGPALHSGETLHLQRVRADYMPVNLGMGTLPCADVLVLPIVQAGRALAVIEIGKVTPFSRQERDSADAIRTHLAYAVTAANAREIAVRAATV